MLIEKCVTSGLKQDSASCLEEFSLGSTNNSGPALLPLSSLKDVVIQCISRRTSNPSRSMDSFLLHELVRWLAGHSA
ncbi:unnamed protein product [Calypogeia fissa]